MAAPLTAAPDETVFHYVRPLRGDEHGALLSIWSGWDMLVFTATTPGWALLDACDQVWGWHRLEPFAAAWSTSEAAFASFIDDPTVRDRLAMDGFRVVADDGALLEVFIRNNPGYGLPPLASGPTGRPAEPILPNWGHLLDLAVLAVSPDGGQHVSTAVEDLVIARDPDFRRPAVFNPAVMRHWLLSDDAPAALSAMRAAAGRHASPATAQEALALLEPLGCSAIRGRKHFLDVHLSEAAPDGDWLIGTCRRCWHPILVHEHADAPSTTWNLFGDLR